MTLAEAMAALEAAGSEQTRKTYLRHGAKPPLYGVSFATFKVLVKRIGVDQELAEGLWNTGVYDARILAAKVADPAKMTPALLDSWGSAFFTRACGNYVALLAAEGPHAMDRVAAWLASPTEGLRSHGWRLVGAIAMRDETLPDSWFEARIQEIEQGIHAAPNEPREAMLGALIQIGCRNEALRERALAAGAHIGPVDIDVGDTECRVPVVADSVGKAWSYSLSKGGVSPATLERGRENLRIRC